MTGESMSGLLNTRLGWVLKEGMTSLHPRWAIGRPSGMSKAR